MLVPKIIPGTGIAVSPIGLGTVKLGRDQGVKYPNQFKIPDDRDASALLAHAQSLGINLIDTAPAYGISETRLGPLLRGQRADWVICTKVGEEFENNQSSFNFSPEHTRFSIDRSLKRLETDFLDIVLVHSDGNDSDIIKRFGIFEVLHELKQAGKIGAYGMSTKTVDGGLLTAQLADIVMLTHNLAYQGEQAVLDYCAEHNKGVFIKKALASGHVCQEKNLNNDPVQASMDFIFQQQAVNSIILGTINPEHMTANVTAASIALNQPHQ